MNALDFAVPQGVKVITAGVDFQIDRAELEFVGWGEGEESWGLGYLILPGDFTKLPRRGERWAYDQIEANLIREFVREDDARMKVAAACFDSGYAAALRALKHYLRPRLGRRYYMTKGSSQKWAVEWAKGKREDRVSLFIIGTNRMKANLYRRATISVVGPEYMHVPKTDDYGEEWFKQFLSEDSTTIREKGVEMQIFEMPVSPKDGQSSRNEALDIRVGALAALYIRGTPVNWEFEEKQNLKTIPPKNGDETAEKTGQRQRKRSNWLNWRQ